MTSHRADKLATALAHEAAAFLAREAGSDTLITVTRAVADERGGRATIFVSVFPDTRSKAALAFLENHRADFSDHLKAHAKLGPLPRISFALEPRGEISSGS